MAECEFQIRPFYKWPKETIQTYFTGQLHWYIERSQDMNFESSF